MIPYNVNATIQGVNGFGLKPSDCVYRVKFDGTTEATVTVPGDLPMGQIGAISNINPIGNANASPAGNNRLIAVFSYSKENIGDVWVALNATAAAPTTNAFVKGAAMLNPTAWSVKAGDVIHAISDKNTQTMSIEFYNIVE